MSGTHVANHQSNKYEGYRYRPLWEDIHEEAGGPKCLANEIVSVAMMDYFEILAGFKNNTAQCNQTELEAFFKGPLFGLCTDMTPEYVMQFCRDQASKMVLLYDIRLKERGKYELFKIDSSEVVGVYKSALIARQNGAKKNGVTLEYYDKMRSRKYGDKGVFIYG